MNAIPDKPQSAGLREAHAHLPWLGKALAMTSLEDCISAEEALDRVGGVGRLSGAGSIADKRSASTSEQWVQAHSARIAGWKDGRWFTRSQLDRVTGNRPAAVMSFDHHAVFANSAALKLAQIDRDTPNPLGGLIERDSHGEPTGLLLESAAFSLWGLAPEPSASEWDGLIRRAVQHLAGFGFKEVHDLFSPDWLGPLLAKMHKAGELPMAVGLFAPLEEIEAIAQSASTWKTDRVRLLGGKIFTDGTLNSRTAWVLHPFADAPPGLEHGKPLMTAPQIQAAIERCARLDLGIAMHAIGDGAVQACLDGIEAMDVQTRKAMVVRDAIRIEHCELIDASDVPRFAELGAVASVQPCHLLADIEALERGVPDRLDRVMPWRDLLKAGCIAGKSLIFGSDVPVVRANPADSIQAAVERCRPGGNVVIGRPQAISLAQAEACFRAGVY